MNRISLKYRIAIIVTVLNMLMVGLVLWRVQDVSLTFTKHHFKAHEQVMLNVFSGLSRYALINSEYGELQPYVEEIQRNPEVVRVLLADYRNRVVVSTEPALLGAEMPSFHDSQDTLWRVREFSNPAGYLGLLAIEFSSAPILKAHREARNVGILIAAISMTVIAMVSILIGYLLTRRLEKLTRGAQRLAEGDWDMTVDISGSDEVAQLGNSFNTMADKIKAGVTEVKNSGEKFRQLAENIPDVFWIGSSDWQEVYYISPAYEEIWGRSCESLYKKPLSWMDSIPDEDRKGVVAKIAEIKKKNSTHLSEEEFPEYRIVRPDGSIRWILARAFPVRNEDGEIYRIAGIAEDITERKQTAKALRRLNRALITLSHANQAMIRAVKEEDLLYAICHILVKTGGYRLAWVAFANHDEKKSVRAVAQAGYENGYLNNIRISWADNEYGQGPTGTAIRTGKPCITRDILNDPAFKTWREQAVRRGYASSIALPLKTDQGVFGALNIYADIPDAFDLKEVELLEELADDLAFGITTLRIREEKTELQAQLRQAQKMEAIGALAGGIAHDFNNILVPILGYSQMILENAPQDSRLREDLSEICKAANRAKDLVKQILAFSRQTEDERKPLEVKLILKETLKLLKASLPSTIDIRSDFAAESSIILADPTQIHQVVMNLCTNAFHAMQEKGGVLEVSLTDMEIGFDYLLNNKDLEPGSYLRLSVSDTGYGMSKATQERIFEPYFTTKKTGEGTGLGLAVVHGIVKNLGGTITGYSEPGKGSAFHVYLPLLRGGKDEQETLVAELPTLGGNEHILVVDDEQHVVRTEQRMLEGLGYRVTARTSSVEALEAFRAQPDKFDLVITDQTMPNITGDHLALEIMSIKPDIPIILCTGFSSMINENKAKALGIQEFIMKPIVKKELAWAIRRVLDKKQ